MVANPNAHWDQVRWEIAPLQSRLPEYWTTWKSNNLSRMAAINRVSHALDPQAFFPLRGSLILTSWSPLHIGEQFILAIPTTGEATRQFYCEVRFLRRSPANTWIAGTCLLAPVTTAEQAALSAPACRGHIVQQNVNSYRWPRRRGISTAAFIHPCDEGRIHMEESIKKSRRGFATMDKLKRSEIASRGGRLAHERGTAHEFDSPQATMAARRGHELGKAHEFTPEEARAAGYKGGLARAARRQQAALQQGGQQTAT